MQSAKDNFIKTALSSLSEEQFDEVVRIFQKEYLGRTVVFVNGTNDYGKDIVIYQDHREMKRCVQVTIEKTVESKLRRELPKVQKLINDFGYSSNYEFFCNVPVSEGKVEDMKKDARNNYGIDLDVYEGKRISQLSGDRVRNYIYSLFEDSPKVQLLKIDDSEKILYNLLTGGISSGDIKKGIIQTMIVFAIFEKNIMDIQTLEKIVERRLHKRIPNMRSHISELIREDRIRFASSDHLQVELTENEGKQVAEIYTQSQYMENDFNLHFKEILDRYGISDYREIMEKLKDLYITNYQYDIDETNQATPDFDQRKMDIYSGFENFVKQKIADKSKTGNLIADIKLLCDNNSYLNKSVAGSAFVSLYSSDKLELYINSKPKWVFFDTPVFVYYLCAKICEEFELEWDNIFLKSTNSLIEIGENHGEISFFVFSNYIAEAVGQLRNAVNVGWMEDLNLNHEFGESRNTFYQCYQFIKENAVLEFNEKMESFDDFIDMLGIDCHHPNTDRFMSEAYSIFSRLASEYNICIIEDFLPNHFDDVKKRYEIQLAHAGKAKSKYAIVSDVKQTLYLLDENNMIDSKTGLMAEAYLATWDESFFGLRKELLTETMRNYQYFYVQNPSKLANKFAIENFNIDASCISNDVFMYAEKEYQISSKVKNLIDMISPLLARKEKKSIRFFGWLSKVRKSEIEQLDTPANFLSNQKGSVVAVDEVMNDLMQFMRSRSHRDSFNKFRNFIFADENYQTVVMEFDKAIDARNRKEKYNIGEQFLRLIQN